MCVVEHLYTNREIMIYRDTLKNQQFQVGKFKRVLKRQGDKHPAVTTSKLLIFLVASFFLSFQITLKVNFSKKCEKREPWPLWKWTRCSGVSRLCKWQGNSESPWRHWGLELVTCAGSRLCLCSSSAMEQWLMSPWGSDTAAVPLLRHLNKSWRNTLIFTSDSLLGT